MTSPTRSIQKYAVDLDSTSRLKSVTQERDLDEFLNTAQLAGTEFTAGVFPYTLPLHIETYQSERRNVKIIQQTSTISQNPHLLSTQEEKKVLEKHAENKTRLRVPRRPAWTKAMSAEELDRQEKASFLEWRRGLAESVDFD